MDALQLAARAAALERSLGEYKLLLEEYDALCREMLAELRAQSRPAQFGVP